MKKRTYTCVECGTVFEATQQAKYCSPRCKSTHSNHVTVRCQCIFCNKIFTARKNNKAKFCSHKCVADAHKYVEENPNSDLAKVIKPRKKAQPVTRYCIDCGKAFETLSSKTVNRRCSDCLKQYRKLWSAGAGELLTELNTATGYKRELLMSAIDNFVGTEKVQVNIGNSRESSSECQTYIEPTKTKDEHNARRRYLRAIRKTLKKADSEVNYDRTGYRKRILEMKQAKCVICGYADNTDAIQVHHIDMNRDNNIDSNLAVLCANCHTILHNRIRRNMYTYDNKVAGIINEFQTLLAEVKSRN